MKFQKVLALRGPNVWARYPVLEAWVDLGSLRDLASSEIPDFTKRLTAWLPSLVEHRCNVGTRGGFFERLYKGTYLVHLLEHISLELQSLAGTDVGFGCTRMTETDQDGVYKVVVRYHEEELGRAALEASRALLLAAVDGRPYDIGAEVARLRELAQKLTLGASAGAVVEAARRRNISVRRLDGGLIQLGHGVRQRRLLGRLTDAAGVIAESVAQDVELTRTLLRAAGVPVPEGRPVSSAQDAWAAAEEIGLPALVKPRYGSRLRGTRGNLASRQDVVAAYEDAAQYRSHLVVERFIPGGDWRLLVVGDGVVAAIQRQSGGPTDATDHVHPEVAARAVQAARVVGLEIAGIDIAAADITRPLEQQGGAVVGVVTRPGLAPHLRPAAGGARPVGEAILAHLFPGGATGGIPIVAVTGANGKTTTTRLTAHLLSLTGRCVGMTCSEGIYVSGRRIVTRDCNGPRSAAWALGHPRVEAAVLETALGGILCAGLGFDHCDVAVVTNIGPGDHLGASGLGTPEQLAYVKSTLVAAVAPGGTAVLRADDPLVVDMACRCRGSVLYFAADGCHEVIVRHRTSGGRAAFVRDGWLVLAEGAREHPLLQLTRVPLTHGGRVGFQVLNALAAAGAAWAAGVSLKLIREGLASFSGRLETVPGRFNLLAYRGGTIVVDYAHNVAALEALVEALDQLPHRRRSIVYSGSSAPREADLVRQGEILGNAFDRVILYVYEDPGYLRGIEENRMTRLFCQGLAQGGRVQQVDEFRSWKKAVNGALADLRPGELLVIQPDLIDETVALLRQRLAEESAAREIDLDEALGARPAGPSFTPHEPAEIVGSAPRR